MRVERFRDLVRVRMQRERLTNDRNYWDARAMSLAGMSASMWVNNRLNGYYHEEALSIIDQTLNLEGKRVLDIGCGMGRWVDAFAQRGAKVTGLDYSPETIELAKVRYPESELISYRCQSLFDVDDEENFDVIYGWGVLVCACRTEEQLVDVLNRLERALAPGGHLLLMEPMHTGPLSRALKLSRERFAELIGQRCDVTRVGSAHFLPLLRIPLSYFDLPDWVTDVSWQICKRISPRMPEPIWWDYSVVHSRKRA